MILEIIVLSLIIATIFNIILNKFRMPTIIWYIITWTIISYIFNIHDAAWNWDIKIIAEFWIVFLMFSIGLEFSLRELIKMRKSVFVYGGLQFLLTTIVFFLIWILFLSLDSKQSLIIWLSLSLSSTAIVLKLLKENKEINKKYWNRAFWILLFQDLMVVPIFLLITVFSTKWVSLSILVLKTILWWIVLLVILRFLWKYLLDYFLYRVAKTKSQEIFIWSILFIIIGSSALSHMLWFSYTLWAFIAGILISETHYKHQVEADLTPFRDLLLWLFFITVGMQLNLWIIFENIWMILIIFISFILFKIIILYSILIVANKKRSAFKTAVSLFQFWEFAIVVFELAMLKNVLAPSIWHVFIVVTILSMIFTPFIIKNLREIANLVFWERDFDNEWNVVNNLFKNHVILIWYGRLWKTLSKLLEKNNISYIILENDINVYKWAKALWKPIIFWNATNINTIKSIWLEDCSSIFISVWDKNEILLIISVIHKLNSSAHIVVKANNFEEELDLKNFGIKNIIVETEQTAITMFQKVKAKGYNKIKN